MVTLTYSAKVVTVALTTKKVTKTLASFQAIGRAYWLPYTPKYTSHINSAPSSSTTTVVILTYSATVVIVAFTTQKATKNAGELARALVEQHFMSS